jgi:hypothetical protein
MDVAPAVAELTLQRFTVPVEDGLLHIQLLDLGAQARAPGLASGCARSCGCALRVATRRAP